MIEIPAGLRAIEGEPGWHRWVEDLPRLARDVLADWRLAPDGAPRHGRCALVLPVRTSDGTPAALKLSWPHDEARHEHLALQHWHGHGAVELLRADPRRWALLLERLEPRDLHAVDALEACEVVAGLYPLLHRPAVPQLDRLSALAASWSERLHGLPASAPVPRRLVEQAAALARDLAGDPATDGTLVHTDLHYENVLAGTRAPWLAIDPKPLSGDPAYEPAPMLWNRWDEVVASGDVRRAVRRRLDTLTDGADLDRDRARDWVVVREVVDALWTLELAEATGRALTPDDRTGITRAVTIAKAVQD